MGLELFYLTNKKKKKKSLLIIARVLSKTERNYCVTRRGLLAIMDSLTFFCHYLLSKRFSIRPCFSQVVDIVQGLGGTRWLERLQQFEIDFEIFHQKGLIYKNANELLRRHCSQLVVVIMRKWRGIMRKP